MKLDYFRMLIRSHKFFVSESRTFVGVLKDGEYVIPIREKIRYPYAYLGFMYLQSRAYFRPMFDPLD